MPLEKVIVPNTLPLWAVVRVAWMPVPMSMAVLLPVMTLRTAVSAAMAFRAALSSSRVVGGRCQHCLIILNPKTWKRLSEGIFR